MIYYGIDPDLEKCGVATYNPLTKKLDLALFTPEEIALGKPFDKHLQVTIIIEAGWLNSGVYHVNHKMGYKTSAEVGRKVGLNHGIGTLIARCLRDLGYKVQLVRPRNKKIGAKYFKTLSGKEEKNQEKIDSAMLLYGFWKND